MQRGEKLANIFVWRITPWQTAHKKSPRLSEGLYPGRDLNPHSHFWPQDFKSCVSTDFTTRASGHSTNRRFPLPVKCPKKTNPSPGERGIPERETRLELATLTLAR